MRAFVIACIGLVAISVVAGFVLQDTVDRSTGEKYSTPNVRL